MRCRVILQSILTIRYIFICIKCDSTLKEYVNNLLWDFPATSFFFFLIFILVKEYYQTVHNIILKSIVNFYTYYLTIFSSILKYQFTFYSVSIFYEYSFQEKIPKAVEMQIYKNLYQNYGRNIFVLCLHTFSHFLSFLTHQNNLNCLNKYLLKEWRNIFTSFKYFLSVPQYRT